MKRIAILLIVTLVSSVAMFAEEATVIDFNKLVADQPADKPVENQVTLTDFSIAAGSSFTDVEKSKMKTSLAIQNWEVKLNSSANTVINADNSLAKAAKVKDTASKYAKESVLGIRVLFPTEPFNAFAEIRPPFEIPGYSDKEALGSDGKLTTSAEEKGKGRKFEGGLGVVKNVGVLKSVSVNAFGLNFPEGFSVLLKDQSNQVHEYFMGNLNFDGWKTLTWSNSNYINDVRNRELNSFPLYPSSAPLLKLEAFRVYRDAAQVGGDFIAYLKDVSIVYDKAVLSTDRDIADEDTWDILQQREAQRRNSELLRLGGVQVQRYLETLKKDNPDTRQGNDAAKTSTTPATK